MTGFRTVSFIGIKLSRNQRDLLQLNKNLRLMRNPDFLRTQVDDALARQSEARKTGIKPYKEWSLIYQATGTPFLGDCFVR